MAPKRRERPERIPPLEMRSREDGAWYDGSIILEGSRLRIHFNNFGDEDDEFLEGACLKSATRIREMIRLRSIQLQDSQCTQVSPGMLVCANYKTADGSESRYYDAKVLAIHPSEHSYQKGRKTEVCKCRFKMAWEAGPYKRKQVVLGCADISLINPENIEKHPVARVVLRAAHEYAEEMNSLETAEDLGKLPVNKHNDELNKDNDILQNSIGTEEPEKISMDKDIDELNRDDVMSDDSSVKKESGGSFVSSSDLEGLQADMVTKLQNYNIFHEFLSNKADELKEALDMYNARKQT